MKRAALKAVLLVVIAVTGLLYRHVCSYQTPRAPLAVLQKTTRQASWPATRPTVTSRAESGRGKFHGFGRVPRRTRGHSHPDYALASEILSLASDDDQKLVQQQLLGLSLVGARFGSIQTSKNNQSRPLTTVAPTNLVPSPSDMP